MCDCHCHDNYNLDTLIVGVLESVEDVIHIGIYGLCSVFLYEKFSQIKIIRFIKLILKKNIPTVIKLYHFSISQSS